MMFGMPQYEVQHLNSDNWVMISENEVMETIAGYFTQVTPILKELLAGKQVLTPEGLFRIKL